MGLIFHIWFCDTCSNSARFLWKSIPAAIKENQPEVVAAWKVGQKLWMRDYRGVYEAIGGFDWSQEAQSLVAAFSGKSFEVVSYVSVLNSPCNYSAFQILKLVIVMSMTKADYCVDN